MADAKMADPKMALGARLSGARRDAFVTGRVPRVELPTWNRECS